MPCTFTHPLAILPLRRLCPARLSFAALVLGSMSPDFGYYLQQFSVASLAHTPVGTFTVCLPMGLLALGLFYLLRKPLCFILPQPHRGALLPLAAIRPSFAPARLLGITASVLIGAWTHTAWDSFTHAGTWPVAHIAFLRAPLFHIGQTPFAAAYVLQQVSTVAGGAALVFAYLLWLRRNRTIAPAAPELVSDRQRYGLLVLLSIVALAVAIPGAVSMAARFEGFLAIRVLVFRTAITAAAVFFPLLCLSSCLLLAICRTENAKSRRP